MKKKLLPLKKNFYYKLMDILFVIITALIAWHGLTFRIADGKKDFVRLLFGAISLLFCLRGSTTGRMNITHDEVSIGRGVCAIKSKFDQDFLVFAMMMVRIYIQDQISGSTFPSVTKDDVDNFIIPLPDHEEQKKISSQ